MSHYHVEPVEPVPLEVGNMVKLGTNTRLWWRVAAVSENFVAFTHQAPFEPKGTLQYTVADWRNGVRGPCDLIGQGWGDGSYSDEACAQMLVEFEYDPEKDPVRLAALASGETSWPSPAELHVSSRNWVRLVIGEVRS